MPLTVQQTQLAETIDTHVQEVLAHGGGDEAVLLAMADCLPTFTQLVETCTSVEMEALCARYQGVYRFARLLEILAEGIADGSIPVPE